MVDHRLTPSPALAGLARLSVQQLATLHEAGTTPRLHELDGTLDGRVLNGTLGHPVLRPLRLWRGKVFDRRDDGTVSGFNRLGLGPAEVRRFRFHARLAPSQFGDREVVVLDHDNEDNPQVVRRFHDELVQVGDGLFLATSHHGTRPGSPPGLRFLCHFALALPGASPLHLPPEQSPEVA